MNSLQISSYKADNVPVFDIHELAAGKLSALFSRKANRDLFDVNNLLIRF
jgi:predicted nucleotidyltransferase component of viral defense system